MTDKELTAILNVLKHKRNIILQGAPGTGKTYQTAAIAVNIIDEKVGFGNRTKIMN